MICGKSRKNVLFSYGNPNSKVMFILDEPNMVEDDSGLFYKGRVGEELKSMILEVGLNIDDIYLTSLVKCKTPNFRTLYDSEILSCLTYLYKQIELVKPKLLVSLGDVVYKSLTKDDSNLDEVRGHLIKLNKIELLPMFHPSYIIKNPSLRDEALKDLNILKRYL